MPIQERQVPKDPYLSSPELMSRRAYAVLSFLSEGYPPLLGRLPTRYSPVRRSSTPEGAFPLDLHVLGAPPAFILSQDQTLQFEPAERFRSAVDRYRALFVCFGRPAEQDVGCTARSI